MPPRIPRPCRKPGCSGLTTDKSGYCDKCKPTESGWAKTQQQKGNSTQRGYGYAWQKKRKLILKRDNYLCQPCKRNGHLTQASEVDHILQKADGGTDSANNLQSICNPCHKSKTILARGGDG